MPPAEFEPVSPASRRSQILTLDRSATGTNTKYNHKNCIFYLDFLPHVIQAANTGDASAAYTTEVCGFDVFFLQQTKM